MSFYDKIGTLQSSLIPCLQLGQSRYPNEILVVAHLCVNIILTQFAWKTCPQVILTQASSPSSLVQQIPHRLDSSMLASTCLCFLMMSFYLVAYDKDDRRGFDPYFTSSGSSIINSSSCASMADQTHSLFRQGMQSLSPSTPWQEWPHSFTLLQT